jgi:hypothetical protein
LPILRAIPRTCAESLCPSRRSESTVFWQISGIFGGTSPTFVSDLSTRCTSIRSGLGFQRA